MTQSLQTWQKEVRAALDGRKRWQPLNCFANRPLRDFEFERSVVGADDRVALIAKFVEVFVVYPYVLREFELSDQAPANHKRRDPALLAVLRRAFRQLWPIRGAAPNHPATVHVRCGVARIHAADVRAERH